MNTKVTDGRAVAKTNHNGLRLKLHPSLKERQTRLNLKRNAALIVSEKGDALSDDAEKTLFRAMHACGYELTEACKDGANSRKRAEELQRRIVDYLVENHMGLIYKMRPQSYSPQRDEAEFSSAGYWALYQSIMAFDPWRGFRFSTYACNAIARGYASVWKQERARQRRLHQYTNLNYDRLSSSSYEADYDSLDKTALRDHLASAINSSTVELTTTERTVIDQRYFRADGAKTPTLSFVGRMVQLSKERVRQIQISALGKLRVALQNDPVVLMALGDER